MKTNTPKPVMQDIEELEARLIADLRQGMCHTHSISDYCHDMRSASKVIESFAYQFAKNLHEGKIIGLLRLATKLEKLADADPTDIQPPRVVSQRLFPVGVTGS